MSTQSQPEQRQEFLRYFRGKVSTVLALIGLVDLTSQLIKWAALIHWIASEYAICRTWLFGWLPFHIPPEWHNYIVLSVILFSVTNVGFYRQTGELYFVELLLLPTRLIGISPIWERRHVADADGLIFRISEFCWIVSLNIPIIYFLSLGLHHFFGVELPPIPPQAKWLALGAFMGATGILIAWRWILGTAFLFGILVGINEIYVHWLAPGASQ
jgi:hypothetical protein